MNGNDESIVNKIKKALGKCFTRRCRRVRRALGQEVSNNSNTEPTTTAREQTRKRRSSMTQEERNAADAAATLLRERLNEEFTGKTAAERKRNAERANFNAMRAAWQEQNLFASGPNAAELYRRSLEEEARQKREEEERQERELREAMQRARRQREAEEAAARERARRQREAEEAVARERARRQREAEEAAARERAREEERMKREREAYEAREQARREAEEEARRRNAAERERARRMPPPPPGPVDCNELLRNLGILDNNGKVNKKAWMKWLIANHPDKFPGISGEQKKIIDERFKLVYGCYESVRKQAGGRKRTQKSKSNKRGNKV